jgi:hypothetical protein
VSMAEGGRCGVMCVQCPECVQCVQCPECVQCPDGCHASAVVCLRWSGWAEGAGPKALKRRATSLFRAWKHRNAGFQPGKWFHTARTAHALHNKDRHTDHHSLWVVGWPTGDCCQHTTSGAHSRGQRSATRGPTNPKRPRTDFDLKSAA